jgi:hypothetical protein
VKDVLRAVVYHRLMLLRPKNRSFFRKSNFWIKATLRYLGHFFKRLNKTSRSIPSIDGTASQDFEGLCYFILKFVRFYPYRIIFFFNFMFVCIQNC